MIFATFLEAITDPATILMTFLMFFGVLLMIIILLQKGRGGGLAGAFGGSGGQSALGTKAGDVFTKITIVMAVIWVVLAGVSGITTRASSGKYSGGSAAVSEETSIGAADGAKENEEETPAADEKTEGGPVFTPAKDLTEKETKAADEKTPAATDEKATTPAEPASENAPKTDAPKEDPKQETPAKPETTKSQPKSE